MGFRLTSCGMINFIPLFVFSFILRVLCSCFMRILTDSLKLVALRQQSKEGLLYSACKGGLVVYLRQDQNTAVRR